MAMKGKHLRMQIIKCFSGSITAITVTVTVIITANMGTMAVLLK